MTIDTGRLARAIWLDCRLLSPGVYLVQGGQGDHLAEVDGQRVTCHCPDAERMGDGCKHSLALRLRAGDSEVIEALRALVLAPDGRSTEHRTPRPHPESPNSGVTGPDLRQTSPQVGPGAANVGDPRGQV